MQHQRTIPELIHTAKTLQTKAEQAQGKAEQFFVSLGLTLAELKERKPKGITWPVFVRKHFPFGKARADELIRIGTGSTTVAAVRAQREASRTATRSSQPRNTAAGMAAHVLEQIARSPVAAAAAQAASQRSAAKKPVNGDLMKQASKLAAELSNFVNNWTVKTEKFWEENREALEAEAGADDPNATSRGLIFMHIETYASNLWGLGQALDGR